VYFVTTDGSGRNVWRTNGTAGGTKELANDGYTFALDLVPRGDTLFFTAASAGYAELWRTDGTVPGTRQLTAFGDEDASVETSTLTRVGSRLFFAVVAPAGYRLYRTGGTAASTVRVKNLPGRAEFLTNAAGTLFFVVKGDLDSWALWKSDGTRSGTVKVKALPGEPSEVVAVGSRLYLSVGSAATGRELWTSNGTAKGTRLVKDIFAGEGQGSDPEGMVAFGGRLAYVAYSKGASSADYEVWVSDGTATGTRMLKNINPDDYSEPQELTVIGNRLWFQADDGVHGAELWSSDGTRAGTKRRTNINPGAGDAFPRDIAQVGKRIWFVADDGTHGREPWRSTDTGYRMVKDIN
jgi:ELWxxDGT repeat protein